MSRSGHLQHPYNLQTMPYCKKCHGELRYVAAVYEGEKGYRLEWECSKCGKVYPEYAIKMPEQNQQDIELHERLTDGNRQNNRRTFKYSSNK